MSKQRATFGKLQRDRDRQAKQAAKRERRINRSHEDAPEEEAVAPADDQEQILTALADLHAQYDDGRLELEEFELRRDELRSKLRVD